MEPDPNQVLQHVQRLASRIATSYEATVDIDYSEPTVARVRLLPDNARAIEITIAVLYSDELVVAFGKDTQVELRARCYAEVPAMLRALEALVQQAVEGRIRLSSRLSLFRRRITRLEYFGEAGERRVARTSTWNDKDVPFHPKPLTPQPYNLRPQ